MAMMRILAAAVLAAGLSAGGAFAGAADYEFEPVEAQVKRGDDVIVAVRLKHKPTGKPVADAVIFRTRIDMAPDDMAEMASPMTPVPSAEPGVYAFRTALTMDGRWLLTLRAKVQGEPETVTGKVVFQAGPQEQ
jgi:hypothetical protein